MRSIRPFWEQWLRGERLRIIALGLVQSHWSRRRGTPYTQGLRLQVDSQHLRPADARARTRLEHSPATSRVEGES